jgi:hypothetical protein
MNVLNFYRDQTIEQGGARARGRHKAKVNFLGLAAVFGCVRVCAFELVLPAGGRLPVGGAAYFVT